MAGHVVMNTVVLWHLDDEFSSTVDKTYFVQPNPTDSKNNTKVES